MSWRYRAFLMFAQFWLLHRPRREAGQASGLVAYWANWARVGLFNARRPSSSRPRRAFKAPVRARVDSRAGPPPGAPGRRPSSSAWCARRAGLAYRPQSEGVGDRGIGASTGSPFSVMLGTAVYQGNDFATDPAGAASLRLAGSTPWWRTPATPVPHYRSAALLSGQCPASKFLVPKGVQVFLWPPTPDLATKDFTPARLLLHAHRADASPYGWWGQGRYG